MEKPYPINLMTTAEVRANGWAAEGRDSDGHLITTHAPFDSDASILEYLNESAKRGETVTIFAPSNAAKPRGG